MRSASNSDQATEARRPEHIDRQAAERDAKLKTIADRLAATLGVDRVKVSVEGHDADHLTAVVLKLADGTGVRIRSKHDNSLAIESIIPDPVA